jgi:hypothetical protein
MKKRNKMGMKREKKTKAVRDASQVPAMNNLQDHG